MTEKIALYDTVRVKEDIFGCINSLTGKADSVIKTGMTGTVVYIWTTETLEVEFIREKLIVSLPVHLVTKYIPA